MKWSLSAVLVVAGALSALGAACTRGGPDLGPVMQLNEDDGNGASFSWPYYTSVIADGDRVAVAWMNQNGKQHRNAMTRY